MIVGEPPKTLHMLFTMTLQAPCNKTASSLRSHRERSQEHGGEQTHLLEAQGAVRQTESGVFVLHEPYYREDFGVQLEQETTYYMI